MFQSFLERQSSVPSLRKLSAIMKAMRSPKNSFKQLGTGTYFHYIKIIVVCASVSNGRSAEMI